MAVPGQPLPAVHLGSLESHIYGVSINLTRRADSIIRDAEVVREAMCADGACAGRWTLLGQSFGGFCAVSFDASPLAYGLQQANPQGCTEM